MNHTVNEIPMEEVIHVLKRKEARLGWDVAQCCMMLASSPGSPSFAQLLRMTFDPTEKCRGRILARERRLGGHRLTQSGRKVDVV